jgi:hypothetical protein
MQPWIYAVLVVAVGCGASHEAGRGAAEGALTGVQKEAQRPDGGPPALESATRNIVRGALEELDTPEQRAELARILGAATAGALAGATGRTPDVRGSEGPSPDGGIGQGDAPASGAVRAPTGAPAGGPWGGGPPGGRASNAAAGGPMAAVGDSVSEGIAKGLSKQLQSELGSSGDGPLGKTLAAVAQQMSDAAANGMTQGLSTNLAGCAEGDRGLCAQERVQDLSRSMGTGFAQGLATAVRVPLLLGAFVAGIAATILLLAILRFAHRPSRQADR